jgi:pyrrolidone-carboxylate peptidase
MYEMLHYIYKHQLDSLAGFIHLPQLPEQTAVKTTPLPSMSLQMMVAAVTAVIETITTSLITPQTYFRD